MPSESMLDILNRIEAELKSMPKTKKTQTEKEVKTMAPKKPLEIISQGKQLIMPEGMDLDEVAKWVELKRQEANQRVAVIEDIDFTLFEGMVALSKAVVQMFGWSNQVPTPGFFGDDPPAMIGIEIGHNETIQIPWGRMVIPGIDGWVSTGSKMKGKMIQLVVQAEVRGKHKHKVGELAALTRKIASEDSIYRAKALELRFPLDGEKFNFESHSPRFLDLANVNANELVLNAEVQRAIDVSLFTPIRHTEACRKAKIPLKRGILLAGPYGTGKTLTAKVAAKLCEENGWTFLLIKNIKQLSEAIRFAVKYAPALVFAEDIDQVLGTDERDESVNEILNTIDGVELKGREVMVALTTNHVEKLNVAMLRPGRLDAVIELNRPDPESVQKLIRLYSGKLLDAKQDLSTVGRKLAGNIPSVIREVVERSKLAQVARGGSEKIEASDLEVATEGMLTHLRLLSREVPVEPNPFEVLGNAVGAQISNTLHKLAEGKGSKPQNHSVGVERVAKQAQLPE